MFIFLFRFDLILYSLINVVFFVIICWFSMFIIFTVNIVHIYYLLLIHVLFSYF